MDMVCHDHIGVNALSFQVVRIAYYSAFYHTCVHIDGVLHFGCANTVATYI